MMLSIQGACKIAFLGPFNHPPYLTYAVQVWGWHPSGWRTIYHLSAPLGLSINDFIDPVAYALNYCTVDDAVAIVNKLRPGTLLSKIDLKMLLD